MRENLCPESSLALQSLAAVLTHSEPERVGRLLPAREDSNQCSFCDMVRWSYIAHKRDAESMHDI